MYLSKVDSNDFEVTEIFGGCAKATDETAVEYVRCNNDLESTQWNLKQLLISAAKITIPSA